MHVTYGTSAGAAPVDYTLERHRLGPHARRAPPHVDADGLQIAPANVIIQFVRYVSSGVTGPVRRA